MLFMAHFVWLFIRLDFVSYVPVISVLDILLLIIICSIFNGLIGFDL